MMKKYRFLLIPLFTIVTLAFSMSPWFYGVLKTPTDRIFGGVNRFSADYYIYVSFVETGLRGDLREYHLTTTKQQEPIWIHGVYTLSGFLGRLIGLDAISTYHLDRLFFGGVFIGVLYMLFYTALRRIFWSTVAMVFVFWIPGWTKTWDIWGPWNMRYLSWVQEMNIVGRATSPPHYLASFSLFIVAIWYYIKGSNKNILKKSFVMIGLAWGITFTNPVNLMTLLGTLGLYEGIKLLRSRKELRLLKWGNEIFIVFLTIVGSLPIAWYYQQKLSIFPWGPRSNAFEFYIPGAPVDLWELVLALGPVLILAVVGIGTLVLNALNKYPNIKISKYSNDWDMIFLSWIVVQGGLFLTSGPRGVDPLRFLQGLYYIPLAYFAVKGIQAIAEFLSHLRILGNLGYLKREKSIAIGIIVLCLAVTLPTTILSYREHLFMNTDYKTFETMVYPTKYQYEAYKWMEKNTPFASGVLAFYEVTEVLPAFSGNTTERDLGHGDKLPFFQHLLTDEEASAFVKKHNFNYVWNGYQARSAGFNPDEKSTSFLKKIYENPEVSVWEVK